MKRTSYEIGLRNEPTIESRRFTLLSSAFMLCVALYFLLPSPLLPMIGWAYYGGSVEFQKIHPATFLLLTVLSAAVVFDRTFRRRCIAQLRSDYALLAFAAAVFAVSVFAIVARGASAANLIETFVLALIVRVAIVAVARRSLAKFRIFIDLLFLMGVFTVFAEFALKRSIIFQNVVFYDAATEQIMVTEFRAAGIFGHPLTAAGFFSLYAILNLVATPIRLSPACATRLLLSGLAFVAVLPTGGRSSLLLGGLVIAAYVCIALLRSLARGSVSKAGLIWFVFSLTSAALMLPLMLHFGVFDTMLARFANDDGSTLSREYALQMIFNARLEDLWFGIDQQDVLRMQRQFGLVAIENSWINLILVCGAVFTVPLFVTYLLLLFRSNPRYCIPAIYYISALQFALTNATNDLWSKNTGFATGLAMIFAFLRKDLFVRGQTAAARRDVEDRSSFAVAEPDYSSLRSRRIVLCEKVNR